MAFVCLNHDRGLKFRNVISALRYRKVIIGGLIIFTVVPGKEIEVRSCLAAIEIEERNKDFEKKEKELQEKEERLKQKVMEIKSTTIEAKRVAAQLQLIYGRAARPLG